MALFEKQKAEISWRISGITFAFVLALCFLSVQARASDFGPWLAGVYEEAAKSGVSTRTLDVALADIEPIDRVIALDRKQPEGKMSFTTYRERIVNPTRVEKGRAMMRQYADILARVEREYGVAPQYIVALWGIETNYGANTGGFDVVPALATLAWEGRRGEFFRAELLDALRIIDQGHVVPAAMKGSWAGAMGQSQFMPSSFMRFAVDGNGDGRKDIWGTEADVFASAANYLLKNGWQTGERWGRAVKLPAGFSASLIGKDVKKPLAAWQALGVTRGDGGALPLVAGMTASLVAPDGPAGPVYLVYDNFRTIMRWNRSDYFATSVGLLADAIAG